MKTIILHRLDLKNFKGVRSFSLEVNGENAKVFGDNATGKTTLFDAFVWLLFDKDSQNKKDFSIKTLMNGEEVHGLEHEVEATFIVNGTKLTLRKVYSEKWTKKRGSAEKQFSGHTTDYFIDGVPSKKKEFTDQVASIVDEEIFKLLTSPMYFNEQLHWQKRRATLLEICGDITEEEVIASNKDLAKLPTILQGRTIENHRKIIAALRAEINKELEKIPVRIDEIEHNLPSIEGLNKQELESSIEKLNAEIDEKQDLISNIRNGNAISLKQREIQEIELELLQIKQVHEAGSKDDLYKLKAQIQEETSNISLLESKQSNLRHQKRFNDESIVSIDTKLQKLRDEWFEINNQEFVHNDNCECPTCGQELPEEQVSATREKALAQFNLNKSKKLEEIDAAGKREKATKEGFQEKNEKLAKDNELIGKQITDKQERLTLLNAKLKELDSSVVDIMDNPAYTSKLQEKATKAKELEELRESAQTAIQSVEEEIMTLRNKRVTLQGDLAKFSTVDQSQSRIEELLQREKDLATEFEKLEQELYLTEEFIRTKVNLLEEKINSKFKYARFKLFEQQINGGLLETCETLYDGVPYGSGLNNAARINVGLDIINTLSEHFGVSAPIFVDNSEAVTRLIDVHSQVIQLIVSEPDKVLRVEYPKHKEEILCH
ncbi:AAA family ATPase [Sutcliffiella sp. NC1]|uniref:AAA family ATPase n=1 Tax=Sutcliffiella sp. NC1 TaxID=3004096 RepID=UPI0022DE7F17|nr:AAA family ATPase [Sutcliffiella sp. NC1]WBL16412.1 AAA family ATPase [Sutcliffiella sp. NC1]